MFRQCFTIIIGIRPCGQVRSQLLPCALKHTPKVSLGEQTISSISCIRDSSPFRHLAMAVACTARHKLAPYVPVGTSRWTHLLHEKTLLRDWSISETIVSSSYHFLYPSWLILRLPLWQIGLSLFPQLEEVRTRCHHRVGPCCYQYFLRFLYRE